MAASTAPTGKHKNLSYDHIATIDPAYIEYLVKRRQHDKCPIFRAWWEAQPKSPSITFKSGKYKGRTYDEVWRTSPRYILKIYDRKSGKLYQQALAWFEFNQARIQQKRLKYATNGEELAVTFLQKHHIPFVFEFSLPVLPGKRFDFMFKRDDQAYILEIDGIQHFKHTKYFHRRPAKFAKYQENDIIKSITALQQGYRLIRIDYAELPKLEAHLTSAFQSSCQIYFSDVTKYAYIIKHLSLQ